MFNLIRNLHLSLSLGQVGSLRLRPPENLRLRKKKTLVTINHMCNIYNNNFMPRHDVISGDPCSCSFFHYGLWN